MAERRLALIKTETTYGVDPTLAAANAVMCEDPSFKPIAQRTSADVARPSVGPMKGFTHGVYGELTFKVPLAASGVAGTAPKWGPLAKACGWAETVVATTSVTYALPNDPRNSPSVWICWREGLRLHVLKGARGMMTTEWAEGSRPMLVFTFRGNKEPVADGATLVPADATWTGWNDVGPVTSARTAFTFNGQAPPFRSFASSQTDNVRYSDRPNQQTVELLGKRTLTGKLRAGVLLPSVLNYETLAESDALVVGSIVHGAVAGAIVTVNFRAQLGEPSYADDNGHDLADIDLSLMPTALDTDNELSFVLT